MVEMGPVWLDIPLDIQSAIIETETLQGYTPEPKSIRPINLV
jgi:hypothetical protein